MHRLFFAAAVSLGALSVALPAIAQDSDHSWTGLYVGVDLGGAWGNTSNQITASAGGGSVTIPPGDITTINGIRADNSNDLRFIGGGEAGYTTRRATCCWAWRPISTPSR